MPKTFDLEVFNSQTHTVMTEITQQKIDVFNEASGGTIVLHNAPTRGDFDIRSKFKEIAGLVKRRDAYGKGAVDAKRLTQLLDIAVKVAAGTPPVEWEKQMYLWTQQNPELAAIEIGEQLAAARIADMLNTAIKGGVAAISSNAKAITDLSSERATFRSMNKAVSKFGDASGRVRVWVMHSTIQTTIYDNALRNNENLFSFDGVNVSRDGEGRLFVVTDSPDLIKSEGVFNVLGLVEGAIVVSNNDDYNAIIESKTGDENLQYIFQAEWTFNLGIKGYAWNTKADGAQSPTDEVIGLPASWNLTATDVKSTAGVLLIVGDYNTPLPDNGGAGTDGLQNRMMMAQPTNAVNDALQIQLEKEKAEREKAEKELEKLKASQPETLTMEEQKKRDDALKENEKLTSDLETEKAEREKAEKELAELKAKMAEESVADAGKGAKK